MKKSFYIAGGDLRSVCLAEILAEKGHDVKLYGFGNFESVGESMKINDIAYFENAENIILPLPCCDSDGYIKAPFSKERIRLRTIIEHAKKGSVLMGGLVPEEEAFFARGKGIIVYDYYHREEFAVRNAALTAEGAAALAMDMLTESISRMPVLVLGHGRIGRLLSSILKALDADVTVAARRFSELAWIRSEGMKPVEFRLIDAEIPKQRIIFNTVPAPVLTKERLMLMNGDAFIIDLASEPCGTDFSAAEELGITAKKASGIPGKFAPRTAGAILGETVLNILSEREDENVR